MFYLASIYIFILNYICMHVLRHYGSLKMCKECICVLMIRKRIYKCIFKKCFTDGYPNPI